MGTVDDDKAKFATKWVNFNDNLKNKFDYDELVKNYQIDVSNSLIDYPQIDFDDLLKEQKNEILKFNPNTKLPNSSFDEFYKINNTDVSNFNTFIDYPQFDINDEIRKNLKYIDNKKNEFLNLDNDLFKWDEPELSLHMETVRKFIDNKKSSDKLYDSLALNSQKDDSKKDDSKKDDSKKDDSKKDDSKKDDSKKDDSKKNDSKKNDSKKNDSKKNDSKKNDSKKNDSKKNDSKG